MSQRIESKMEEYKQSYDLTALNANDRTLLDALVRSELMVEDLQDRLQELVTEDPVKNSGQIKVLHDLIKDALTTNQNLQKTLGIDRRSRKDDNVETVTEYIQFIKDRAREFLEEKLTYVYCDKCKVLVGRVAPVHGHTAFSASFQCSQCKEMVRIQKKEKDKYYDIKDHQWRRKHQAEIVQPRKDLLSYFGGAEEIIKIDGDYTPSLLEDIDGTKEETN